MKKSDVASLVVYALMLVSLFLTFFFGAKDAIGVLNLGFGTIGIALGVIFIAFIVGIILFI
jgi:TRAP-type C4-dicarboxylate transport system permease small subunit